MKKFLLAISLLFVLSGASYAAHIKGGFFTYEYLGPGNGGNLQYRVTLTVYMICNASTGQISDPINFSIYSAGNGQFVQDISVGKTNEFNLGKTYDEPCITGNQIGCYYKVIVYDLALIELPPSSSGYIIAYQRCCRIGGINNLISSGSVGNTFSITIPGTNVGQNAVTNSSPVFLVNDTAVVCANSFFQYSFEATDPNLEDSLAYEFCDAFNGASQSNPAPTSATAPPYATVPYASPFSGTRPMGASVTIDPRTGLISGIAPGQGTYVVCVCVKEYRQGVLINTTRKELHVDVGDCNPLKAQLNPRNATCDGFTVNFQNDAPGGSVSGTEFHWTFGEPSSGSNDTSLLATPSHTYTDTGVYTVKLKVALAGGLCADSASFQIRVFPGFFPGFEYIGGCFQNPFRFRDTTNTRYGVVDTWRWNFGDNGTLADTSRIQNPQWTYPSSGQKTVSLIVTNSKGCVDTADVIINVLDKPIIQLDFIDTLICVPDAVTLNASNPAGTGVFSWTPLTNITNPNTASPTVNPTTNTWYVVQLNDNGCLNKDSVHVRVVGNVTLNAMADTTICRTDAVQLTANTDGLQFTWSPGATLSDPAILNPVATPTLATTTYQIVARIGSCQATDNVIITTVPYPIADAGSPQTICYNTSTQLNGTHDGSSFTWTPALYLNDPRILNPISSPPRTTQYILSSFDTRGCPKPGRDTILITVNPRVRAFAGRDTTVVVGQPLQFNGTGGVNYVWTPPSYLSNPNIANPIAIYGSEVDSIRYKLVVTDAIGCPDSAFVKVNVFKTAAYVFVPTAFTPNNDGLNDLVAPIAVGMQRINYFSIYNRWGQLVFTTTVNGRGWDGRIGGAIQTTGVFVWMVSAIDYTGRPFFQKGTVALIR